MTEHKQIAVIGGGITGLAAAFYLKKEITEKQLPYQVNLIEESDRLGGKIKTESKNGFTIERGPDSFLARKESAAKLAKEVGLEGEFIRNGTGQSYILVGDNLHKMPKGSFMGVPTQVRPFLLSTIFSPKGKLRAGLDFVLPKSKPVADQSVGGFFRRRLGDELVENLIEPLLSGIYASDIDDLSLMATFPNFYKLEQEHGSVVRGLQRTMPKLKKQKAKKTGMFLSLENGLESLVAAVEAQLGDDTVMKGTSVDHIEKKDQGYHLLLGEGKVHKADAVVLATPHFAAQRMLSQYTFMEPLKEMAATSVATVAMAFDASAIKKDIDGTGFVVSRNSDYRITACTWTHKKWPSTTPEGKVLLRCYVGRPGDEGVVDLSDEDIVAIVLHDLNKIMNITQEPEFSIVSRWKNAMPQYSVGHKQRLAQVQTDIDKHLPGVFIAGSSYEGIGIPDCIDQGVETVEKVIRYLNK
ncbi:protoporphyrinogen oxidase [Aquibacillus sp. 3ASR75-11]|uniref:Coproporphyrinogen III oxidase n=1 Tax=Terrihalobacillus insolitus TaxID=2950438 RepID=A0A9X4API8_9BACI|nr:protoporphyrinogen oxidase [Terrihalobacillus insolitus]MDC3425603.1 protoporphyrinogen oxidase [Terrihalobacillus insolitus]